MSLILDNLKKTHKLAAEVREQLIHGKSSDNPHAIEEKAVAVHVYLGHIIEKVEWRHNLIERFKREFGFACLTLLSLAVGVMFAYLK